MAVSLLMEPGGLCPLVKSWSIRYMSLAIDEQPPPPLPCSPYIGEKTFPMAAICRTTRLINTDGTSPYVTDSKTTVTRHPTTKVLHIGSKSPPWSSSAKPRHQPTPVAPRGRLMVDQRCMWHLVARWRTRAPVIVVQTIQQRATIQQLGGHVSDQAASRNQGHVGPRKLQMPTDVANEHINRPKT